MADFQQRMKDWQRMCDSMQSGIRKCDNCPLFKVLCQYKPNEKADFAEAERIIDKWAAEHPEPVYPTWIDWLMLEGVIPTHYMAANSTDSGVRAGTFYVTSKAFAPIPADIAKKLGIEPKEDLTNR